MLKCIRLRCPNSSVLISKDIKGLATKWRPFSSNRPSPQKTKHWWMTSIRSAISAFMVKLLHQTWLSGHGLASEENSNGPEHSEPRNGLPAVPQHSSVDFSTNWLSKRFPKIAYPKTTCKIGISWAFLENFSKRLCSFLVFVFVIFISFLFFMAVMSNSPCHTKTSTWKKNCIFTHSKTLPCNVKRNSVLSFFVKHKTYNIIL